MTVLGSADKALVAAAWLARAVAGVAACGFAIGAVGHFAGIVGTQFGGGSFNAFAAAWDRHMVWAIGDLWWMLAAAAAFALVDGCFDQQHQK